MKKKLLGLILFFLSSFLSAQINLTSSLTACYPLNGNANEPINNLNGVLSAVTPTLDRFGTPNSAYYFNGTASNFIELPDNPLIKPTNGVSFSCWVKPSVAIDQYVIFTRNPATSTFEAYEMSVTTQFGAPKFRVRKGNGSSTAIADGTTTVVPFTWYHFAATIDNSSIKIYINGVLENSVNSAIPITYLSGKKVYIGGSNEIGYNIPFNGTIDNFRIYNRVINAAEVNQLFQTDPSCLGGPVPVASFSVSSLTSCSNQSLTLTDLSTNTPTAWLWQMAGATPSVSSVSNPVVSYPASGIYTISLVSSNSFGSSSQATQTITVAPNPSVTISASNTLICSGATVLMVANGANTYTWSSFQTFQAISVSPTVTTMYFVVGASTNGCQNSSFVTINVNPCTSINELESSNVVSLFPNPTSGSFTVYMQGESDKEVIVYNSLGKIVHSKFIESNEKIMLDIGDLSEGIYLVRIKTNSLMITKKIVKE